MESPATGVRPMFHRKPLQPKNTMDSPTPARPDLVTPKKKPAPTTPVQGNDGKENNPVSPIAMAIEPELGVVMEVSLAEELGAARRRKERLRSEKGRMEKVLKEMDLVLERGMREMERRVEEQRTMEAEIRRMIMSKDLGFSKAVTKPSAFQSLREKEKERKSRESQTQPQEIKSDVREKSTEENIEAEVPVEEKQGNENMDEVIDIKGDQTCVKEPVEAGSSATIKRGLKE